ncbi:MAG: SCO family protein [Alphaproteobacteria bacterium]|jgi:protein SCO1/2|nr:MAG: SCO family protein [Alphaproteobacteria bacterium]TMK14090.1 MAG: SCO family protein [Alphaproteobacteria bacterium]TMK31425.1 MAG: SCO family protein [Alphaproteobacteria bacterium]HYW61978.1 SCO family protein [Bradyrhizobium sp.]
MASRPANPRTPPRFALVAIVFAGVLVIAAGVLLALALRETPRGAAGTALASAIGGQFQLIDQNGKPFSDANLKGKWHLIFFGYTHCPDACPTALNEMSLALDRLGIKRDEVGVVFITVDPERDTPDVLKSYVQSFDAPIVALTGSPEAVAQAAKAYRVFYAKHPRADGDYDMDHSAVIYVMNPEGRFTATFTPDSSADAIVQRLQKLIS